MINASLFMLNNSMMNNNDSIIDNTMCGDDGDPINNNPIPHSHLHGILEDPTLMFPPTHLPYLK